MEAMEDEDDNVILQGMEFWSTVAERERDLEEDAETFHKSGQIPPVVSKHYTLGAIPHIVPGILKLLAKQEETDDEDDWTVAKGANICLTLLAIAAKDMILEVRLLRAILWWSEW
jgi:importin subunit beta-1